MTRSNIGLELIRIPRRVIGANKVPTAAAEKAEASRASRNFGVHISLSNDRWEKTTYTTLQSALLAICN